MSTEMGYCRIHKRLVHDFCIECESEVYDQDNETDFLIEMENNEDQMIHEEGD